MRLIYRVLKVIDTMAFHITTLLFILCTQCIMCVASDSSCPGNFTVSPRMLKVQMKHSDHFTLTLCHNLTDSLTVTFGSDETIASVQENVTIEPYSANVPYRITVTAHSAGSTVVNMTTDDSQLQISGEHVQITVIHSEVIDIISIIIGWIYFTVWSISFYPQVWLNFRRKSVVGLSFDFLAYNFTGFLAYGVFNVGLYWIDAIKEEYEVKHPFNPVQLNDVVFTLHALFITSVTIFQTFIYERGGQKVTMLCWTLQSVAWVFVAVILIITAVSEERLLTWLMFVTFISYIKLGVTLIKYIPQLKDSVSNIEEMRGTNGPFTASFLEEVRTTGSFKGRKLNTAQKRVPTGASGHESFELSKAQLLTGLLLNLESRFPKVELLEALKVWMNFRRKSTVGWSIGNVLLDFTGGTFSILQMFLLSYNSNDWSSFFGDPTKFGLGLFSICFDIVFILQHYVWYRGKEEKEGVEEGEVEAEEEEPTGVTDVERLINADPKDH